MVGIQVLVLFGLLKLRHQDTDESREWSLDPKATVEEAAREKEKHKWQNFSTKAFGKKGFVKKSIFKTPENAQVRVALTFCLLVFERVLP